jgi:S-formylglutathione hydrolase FrmB
MRISPVVPTALLGLALAAPAGAAPAPTPGWPACVARTAPIRTGIAQTARTASGRLVTLTLASKAMSGAQKVNVLLPAGYRAGGTKRYPVLYLLHGAAGSYADWAQHDVQGLIGDLPVIVVMPDGGADGSYSDWAAVEPGRSPVPTYESYDIDELVPFVDAHFATLADGAHRAIAGLSMGGHGAMKYAAEYPGMFGYAGAFSGAVDPELPLYQALIKQCTWGDPAIDGVVWRDNDPTDLAGNLRGVRLFDRTGDGKAGPFEAPGAPDDVVETIVGQMNVALKAALDAAHVPVDFAQSSGTHTWPYWQRDLGQFVPWLRAQLARPVTTPKAYTMQSAHAAFTAWGWSFTARRAVREFTYIEDAGRGGLRVTGSGTLTAITPPDYAPRKAYTITTGATKRVARADGAGRLKLVIGLGASHTAQQTAFDAAAIRSWRSVTVRIAASRRAAS